tara:strand:- start:16487 stop:17260 length:774 start_codon:yes stop_codon:yes gene_type:complete
MPNTFSSTQGGIQSNINSVIASLIVNDSTSIPNGSINNSSDETTSLDQLIYDILLVNRDALFNDVRVAGNLNTEAILIDNQLSIGDTSGSTFQVLQFNTKNIYKPNGTDQVIADISYEIINDISLSFRAKNSHGYYQLGVTFNYLTSTYYNTFLKIGLFYYTTQTDLGIDSPETLIGEYVLGSENASFTSGIFSKTILVDISHAANDTINFYLKAKIQTDLIGNDFSYSDVEDTLKPKIIQTLSGNLITAAEFSYFT